MIGDPALPDGRQVEQGHRAPAINRAEHGDLGQVGQPRGAFRHGHGLEQRGRAAHLIDAGLGDGPVDGDLLAAGFGDGDADLGVLQKIGRQPPGDLLGQGGGGQAARLQGADQRHLQVAGRIDRDLLERQILDLEDSDIEEIERPDPVFRDVRRHQRRRHAPL